MIHDYPIIFPGIQDCKPTNQSRVDWNCCTVDNPCINGYGDCDEDSECYGNLVCGKDNCGSHFPDDADCCEGEGIFI